MSSMAATAAVPPSSTASKPKKAKKKKTSTKGKDEAAAKKTNGVKEESVVEEKEEEGEESEQEKDSEAAGEPGEEAGGEVKNGEETRSRPQSELVNGRSKHDVQAAQEEQREEVRSPPSTPSHITSSNNQRNRRSTVSGANGGTAVSPQQQNRLTVASPTATTSAATASDDTEARFDALARDRHALRDEVTRLRKSLESIQERHADELTAVRGELADTQTARDEAESQYRNLLGKVNTIRSQLGERLKADAQELAAARAQIDELEESNAGLAAEKDARAAELKNALLEDEERSREMSTLRNRLNLSQQNWAKEREELAQREKVLRGEFESATQAMQDWEVLAMEERSIRENLADKVVELEEQVDGYRETHLKLQSERDSQALAVDGLQRSLQELQDTRKRELRELVENSQSQLESLRKEVQEARQAASQSKKTLDTTQTELQRILPFEVEVKEKSLLIGKLRHEAVILNDHLTKALKQLRKGKADDTIDRQLISNHFLQFLNLDRSDPKKFQVLQIMSSLLNWNDEQREQAGLARPGTSNPSLRTPIPAFGRTPSTPNLDGAGGGLLSPANSVMSEPVRGSRPESRTAAFGSLFSTFLDSDPYPGGGGTTDGGRSSRSPSVSSSRR